MTDKERLEEIKKVIESQKESVRKLSVNDAKWLIQEAKEKQRLKERVQEMAHVIKVKNKEMRELSNFLKQRNIPLKELSPLITVMHHVQELEKENKTLKAISQAKSEEMNGLLEHFDTSWEEIFDE
ncbi:hypothetical protein J32TS6_18950 [Virgibacillus pantothenticus]|uniref:hypothetical protein n=1 Tax=Virgibacillus pantothenticus TaxID=1473 RepID=UPI001B2BE478|nr:hypothetical protein [Virgibacillus pantothenticus]GIP63340.1 hypothetical protein J32TS6_18950 [Virgibacillus pantothenticus]